LISRAVGAKSFIVTEILNYISAWLTLLAAVFALCVFCFDLASKKNLFSRAGNIKKSWLPRALNKKKSFFDTARYFFKAARSENWQ